MIDVSMNCNSAQCHVIQDVDENISVLGLPLMKYYTEADHNEAVEWLYVSWWAVGFQCHYIVL